MYKSQDYPSDWIPRPLGEICEINIGGTPSRDQDRFWAQGEDGYPWVAISDMGPKLITKTNERITKKGVINSNAKSVRAGTTLMSFKLTLGRMGIAGIDLYTNEAIAAFVPKSKDVDSKWLYHFLPEIVMSATAEQAIKGQTLNKKKLNSLTAYLPSDYEQRRIAEILDTIDEVIQKTEALISKLKAMKQGLLHDLLTRGLDKNGKLRDPKVHPKQFKDSPLGRIPKEWDVRPLGVTATLQRGFDLPIQDRRAGDVPIFGSNGIDGHHNESRVSRPGVITGRSGSIGFVYYTDTNFWPLNTTLYVKEFHGNRPKFIRLLLEFLRLDRFTAATGVPSLNRNFVHPIEVTVPEPAEQDRIVDVVEAHDARIRTEEQYRDKLTLQKKGLMHDLLTGKVRVKV